MKYSGERYIPDSIKSSIISFEHWHRYHFASALVEDKVVLDVACGAGYGSHLLAQRQSKQVCGVDISSETVEYAQHKYQLEHLSFRQGDVCALPFEDNTFDVITSFETIEHIDETQQIKAMGEFQRVLKPGGVLLISTPNLNSGLYKEVDNEFHIKEFSAREFVRFVENYFPECVIMGQSFVSASVISSADATSGQSVLSVEEQCFERPGPFHAESAKFSIAVCSQHSMAEEVRQKLHSTIMVDSQNHFFAEYDDYIESLKFHIQQKEKAVEEATTYTNSLEQENTKLQQHLSDVSSSFAEREGDTQALRAENEQLRNQLQQKEAELKKTQQVLTDETANMSEAYASLRKAFDDKEGELGNFKRDYEEQFAALAKLLEQKDSEASAVIEGFQAEVIKVQNTYEALNQAFESKSVHEKKLYDLVAQKDQELSALHIELDRVLGEHQRYVEQVNMAQTEAANQQNAAEASGNEGSQNEEQFKRE
ncbi:methyltransferase domain-containing protein [Aestuariibacter halophilus]|uniref:Methyltransferase domain-containing protein n=1 Tax=Fluctibacter halophilus TaxID=226011 RepID=A0ABS8G9H6_9ALTE|nr:class I SAM-dependent methyltransferase [Aestuariibacter halophilus]MCC2617227.1 methyltransferase domain-containing protein [Aestuariibacter halophilus]